MTTVRVRFDDEAMRKAAKMLSPAAFRRVQVRVVQRGTLEMRDLMAAYPPEGPWNRPAGPGSRWYQRHFGPRWMRMDGTIGGRNTSEQLQKSWRIRVKGKRGEIYTGVSYAPFVQGDQQAWFHRQHGWHTADDVVNRWRRERAPIVVREEVHRELMRGG